MKINIKQAIKIFFQHPSLEMVFVEAIANSLDAGAKNIDVNISIEAFDVPKSLKVDIVDDGEGFTDERYGKFGELLKVEDDSHKGVGRLVYLCYFDNIIVNSCYKNTQRTFEYNNDFSDANSNMAIQTYNGKINKTKLTFDNCSLTKLSSYDVIKPEYLKKKILQEFYPRLYLMKKDGVKFSINFNLSVSKLKPKQTTGLLQTHIANTDIPNLIEEPLDLGTIQWFEETVLHYSIKKCDSIAQPILITALCVDNRTYNLQDVATIEELPCGYELIFLLSSTMFNGQVNPSRQSLTLNETKKKQVVKIFRNKIAEIIRKEIPQITESNEQIKTSLNKTYPHLIGYFEDDDIGFISRIKSIENAQQRFLRDQKEILETTNLSDDKYSKALDISARTLAEYILYREKIITKLSEITNKTSEDDIHNLILPKGTICKNDTALDSIYNNNLWLLDDKYMTYTTALSDKTMKSVIKEITQDEDAEGDNTEPDIAIIFSNNPEVTENAKVDVVIVELKKKGLKLAKTEEVISQLKQRARRLMEYYPNKIQRIWFYGIVEFSNEFKISLKEDEYTPLYSKDSLYYKENKIYLDLEDSKPYLVGTYILSMDAFIEDAKARNSTFLQLLKDNFRKNID